MFNDVLRFMWVLVSTTHSSALRLNAQLVLSSATFVSSISQLRDGWLVLDRVIDAPVYQDTLTWNRLGRARLRQMSLCSKVKYLSVLALLKAVDCLLIAKPVATNHLGIRLYCAVSLLHSRWMVVLFEGSDLCYIYNREKDVWNLWDRGTRCFDCVLQKTEYCIGNVSGVTIKSLTNWRTPERERNIRVVTIAYYISMRCKDGK
jgi:hypothetical protein